MINKDCIYIVGIDTGTNTGFSIWDKIIKQLIKVDTIQIDELIEFVLMLKNNKELSLYHFRVEDARLRTWIPKQANAKAEKGRAMGAGSVKRDASILDDFFKRVGASYEMVAPKNNKTKWSAEYFTKVTGWTKRCSEHARDSVGLCYGF